MKKLIKKISLIFFSNQNFISYNIFNRIFKLIKCKSNSENELVNNYIKNGYSKSKKVPENDIEELNKLLENSEKIHKDNVTNYTLNDQTKEKIKSIFFQNFCNDIEEFKKYYSSDILITNIKVWINHSFEKNKSKEIQFFSENYHTDNYLFTYFKLFVNLEDVDQSKGPLHFIPINRTKQFIKQSGYKNRYNYSEHYDDNIVFKNIGKLGDSIFFNSAECLHRAGVPEAGFQRKMLMIVFNAVPDEIKNDYFFLERKHKNDIFYLDRWSRIFGKPNGIINTYKFLLKFFISSNKISNY